jgi:threonine dehydrogenase-like Zn-dependent dehydrogenase
VVGKVIEGSSEWLNEVVHVMHPHQDYMVVPTQSISKIPPGISAEVASLTSNMETALNAAWDAGLQPGHKVLVLGFGLIGGLIASLSAAYPGIEVQVLEKEPNRINIARKMGFETEPEGKYDRVFHSTGSDQGLQQGIDRLAIEGKLIEMSWYGNKEVKLNLGGSFHYQRKQIISSQVSLIPEALQPKIDHKKRKSIVFELLKTLPLAPLIEPKISFPESPDFFEKLKKGPIEAISTLIKY